MNDYYSIYFFLVFSDIMLFCNFCMHKYNYTHMLFFLISHHNLRDLWKYRIRITHIYFKVWKILHWGRLTEIDITILILWSLFSLLIIWSDDYSLYLVCFFFCIFHNIFSGKIPRSNITKNKGDEHFKNLDTYSKVASKKGCTNVYHHLKRLYVPSTYLQQLLHETKDAKLSKNHMNSLLNSRFQTPLINILFQ